MTPKVVAEHPVADREGTHLGVEEAEVGAEGRSEYENGRLGRTVLHDVQLSGAGRSFGGHRFLGVG